MSIIYKAIQPNKDYTEINESYDFSFEIPLRGWTKVDAVSDTIVGQTGNRYFDKYIRYTTDGILYSDWELLSGFTMPHTIDKKSDFIVEFKYIRVGTDGSGTLSLNEIKLQGDYSEVYFNVLNLSGTIFEEIEFDNERWNKLWINLLKKLYEKGLVPEYVERGDITNNDDEDYILWWKVMAYFFAYIIELGSRKIGELTDELDTIKDYLKQKSFLICEEGTLEAYQYLVEYMYDELRQRGTNEITQEKAEQPEISIVRFFSFADIFAREYVIITAKDETKYGVYIDKTGSQSAPTSDDWERLETTNKTKADVSGATTGADIAAIVETEFNGLPDFTTKITTNDSSADGDLFFTQNFDGYVANIHIGRDDGNSIPSIEVIMRQKGVDRKVNGELLRYICFQENDEFLFEFLPNHFCGWNVNNTSPMFRGQTNNHSQFNKAPEKTRDIVDIVKYNPIKSTHVSRDVDVLSRKHKLLIVVDDTIGEYEDLTITINERTESTVFGGDSIQVFFDTDILGFPRVNPDVDYVTTDFTTKLGAVFTATKKSRNTIEIETTVDGRYFEFSNVNNLYIQEIYAPNRQTLLLSGAGDGLTNPSGIELPFIVDPYLSYEVTFFAKLPVGVDSLTMEAYAFNDALVRNLKNVVTLMSSNLFFDLIAFPSDSYYFVRAIIYANEFNDNDPLSIPNATLNIGQGQSLKFDENDTNNVKVKILNKSASDIRIWDVKIKPLWFDENSCYTNGVNICNLFVYNRNSSISIINLEENVLKYLLPYGSTLQAIYSPKSKFSPIGYLLTEMEGKILQETEGGIHLEQ